MCMLAKWINVIRANASEALGWANSKLIALFYMSILFYISILSHIATLSMHRCNTRLSCLVCFSRADFADHVKPRLRQWDPWRALDGRHGSDIHPCVTGETSHRPSRLVKAYD